MPLTATRGHTRVNTGAKAGPDRDHHFTSSVCEQLRDKIRAKIDELKDKLHRHARAVGTA
jgi:hypothetical protein